MLVEPILDALRPSRASAGADRGSGRSSCTRARATTTSESGPICATADHRPNRPDRHRASQRLGRHRWVVERSIAWLTGYRRLTLRYERCARLFTAFLTLAATLTCYKTLTT
jgi:hypothetical protein